MNRGHRGGQRDEARLRECFFDHGQPEVVIGMAVRDVHGREVLATRPHLVDDLAGIGQRERPINQDGVVGTGHQGGVDEETLGRAGDDAQLQRGRRRRRRPSDE